MEVGSIDVLEPGDSAPEFSLRGTDDISYELTDFADAEVLVIVFTCNHCPYAKAKQPALNNIARSEDDVAVIGINPNDAEQYPDDSFEAMQSAVKSGTIELDAYLHDETQSTASDYGAMCTPDTFVFHSPDTADPKLAYHGRIDDAMSPEETPSGEPGFILREVIDALKANEDVAVEAVPARGCSIKWKPGNEPPYWDHR